MFNPRIGLLCHLNLWKLLSTVYAVWLWLELFPTRSFDCWLARATIDWSLFSRLSSAWIFRSSFRVAMKLLPLSPKNLDEEKPRVAINLPFQDPVCSAFSSNDRKVREDQFPGHIGKHWRINIFCFVVCHVEWACEVVLSTGTLGLVWPTIIRL